MGLKVMGWTRNEWAIWAYEWEFHSWATWNPSWNPNEWATWYSFHPTDTEWINWMFARQS